MRRFLLLLVMAAALLSARADAQYNTLLSQAFRVIHAINYGVVANLGSDQTTAVQAALNAAQTNGVKVVFPSGTFIVNAVTVPTGVSIEGQEDARVYQGSTTLGTVFTTTTTSGTTPMFTMSGNNTMRWIYIYGAGSDGYGNSTTRENIQVTGGSTLFDDIVSTNGYVGIDGNYQSQIFVINSRIGSNQTGIENFVDSQISDCVFNSNGVDGNLGAGANHNRIVGNRFEFNGVGASWVLNGGFGWSSTAATNNTTSTSSSTLHFASAPSGAIQGYLVWDETTTGAIAAGTYVTSASPSTSLTMSANATGSGVSSGDTILFYLTQNEDNVFTGNQWDRSYLNAINASYTTGLVVVGNIFNRGGAGATANTANDAEIQTFVNTNFNVHGNSMRTNKSDSGTGPNSPSYGVYDDGGCFNCQIKNNTIVYNKVNGTNGGGINVTTWFTTFNTDNSITLANPYILGQP